MTRIVALIPMASPHPVYCFDTIAAVCHYLGSIGCSAPLKVRQAEVGSDLEFTLDDENAALALRIRFDARAVIVKPGEPFDGCGV